MLRRFIRWNKQKSERLQKRFPKLFYYSSYGDELKARIAKSLESRPKRVLEAGGIDRPILAKDAGFEYVGIDIDSKPTCFQVYDDFYVQSIEEPIDGEFGLIISMTLLEHVPDNEAAIQSMFDALSPGGATHHYIPSKWHPYSVALRIVGPKWQKRLIPILRSGSEDVTGYPAFFDHCTSHSMSNLFERVGFENVDVKPYYWATDYFSFFFPLFFLVNLFEQTCYRLKMSVFASGFVISARKPS